MQKLGRRDEVEYEVSGGAIAANVASAVYAVDGARILIGSRGAQGATIRGDSTPSLGAKLSQLPRGFSAHARRVSPHIWIAHLPPSLYAADLLSGLREWGETWGGTLGEN